MIRNSVLRALGVVQLGAMCVIAVGCGEAAPPGTSEPERITTVITGLNDAAGDQEAFASLFVSGAAPEDMKPYASAGFEVVGIPEVSGDQATATVNVVPGLANSQEGDAPQEAAAVQGGEVTWTLEKSGDEWKIKDAPLP